MARNAKDWPAWYREALDKACAKGHSVAKFATQEECQAHRLAFYKFLKEVRADDTDPLNQAARQCTVQWTVAEMGSKVKCVLRFDIRAHTANPLVDDSSEVEEQLEIERLLQNLRRNNK